MNTRRVLFSVAACAALLLIAGAALAAQEGGAAVAWWVISGGGAPSSATGVTLNDTVGQPVIGLSSGSGGIALSAGYWVSCVAAPAVVPVVTAARSGADVVLAWDANAANVQYQVWVSTTPYFDPDSTPPAAVVAAGPYIDTGAAASLVNHFYVVRGLNACGAASGNSARKGEFTFGMTPGH